MSPSFSIVILTLNEAENIGPCVENARKFSDDVVVLDSGSKDATREIAERSGARVFINAFESFAAQRNHAIASCGFRHQWVFHLDADERLTPELAAECAAAADANKHSGYFIPTMQVVFGRWLKRASCYPVFQMRFHRMDEVDFVQVGHGQREGKPKRGFGHLKSPYLHSPLSKGFGEWFQRHNTYSSAEAREAVANFDDRPLAVLLKDVLFSRQDLGRWRALKRLSTRAPFPFATTFLYLFVYRRGFLDGPVGMMYCCMQSIYQEMIRLKIMEIRRNEALSANPCDAAEADLQEV